MAGIQGFCKKKKNERDRECKERNRDASIYLKFWQKRIVFVHMLTMEQLLHMRSQSFKDINPEEIPDIKDLEIDVKKSKREKILGVLESERNPYFIRSGNILVKIGFASTTRTIEEALESLVQMKW